MTDPLAGMGVKEARELVAGAGVGYDVEPGFQPCWSVYDAGETEGGCRKLLALAALGAECVGATEHHIPAGKSCVIDYPDDKSGMAQDVEYHGPVRVLVLKEDK